jgi:hypothetical protein
MIHTEAWKGGYRASLYAYPDRGPDAPASIAAHITGPDDHFDCYEAGQDLDHALEAVAAARNSGFNFDRFKAEQRYAAAAERDELDLY